MKAVDATRAELDINMVPRPGGGSLKLNSVGPGRGEMTVASGKSSHCFPIGYHE
jgi:hypothetical protein